MNTHEIIKNLLPSTKGKKYAYIVTDLKRKAGENECTGFITLKCDRSMAYALLSIAVQLSYWHTNAVHISSRCDPD